MRSMAQIVLLLFIGSLLFTGPALASDPFIYPNKGQSKQQEDQDKHQCYNWAKQQTGFDPMAQPTASAPPPPAGAPVGGPVRGGARGAVAGLAIGSLSGNAGKGAAIGAVAGGLFGGIRRREQVARESQAQEQWANQQGAEYEHKRASYNRAFGACMEGRGYTVK